jgi:ribosomal protein L6P/L9E
MKIIIDPKDIQNNMEGISIQIKGHLGNPECDPEHDEHVYIERWQGQITIRVWNESPNAQVFKVNPYQTEDKAGTQI